MRSFKRHCIPSLPLNLIQAPKVPAGCKIVCFHGRPAPMNHGREKEGALYYHCKEPQWFTDNWGINRTVAHARINCRALSCMATKAFYLALILKAFQEHMVTVLTQPKHPALLAG